MSTETKRLGEDLSSPEFKKRKVLDTLEEDGPLTQEEVVYFQKEAIFRKLKLYKKEAKIAENSLRDWKRYCELNAEKFTIVDSWWYSVIELLKSNGLKAEKSDFEKLESFQDVLKVDGEKYQGVLELRQRIILDIILPALKQVNSSSVDTKDLKDQVNALMNDLSLLKTQNSKLLNENTILNDDFTRIKDELLDTSKKLERLGSKTLKRTDDAMKEEKIENEPVFTKNGVNDHLKNGMDSKEGEVKVKEELNSNNTSSTNNEEAEKVKEENEQKIEDLKIKLSEVNTQKDILEKQLQDEMDKCAKFKIDFAKLESRILNLSENDLRDSAIYQNLLARVENLTAENAELVNKDKTLLEKIASLESSFGKFQESFELKLSEEKKSLEIQIEKVEKDLTRVRSVRDELQSKLDILKGEKKNEELYGEMMSVIEDQKREIEELKKARSGLLNIDANKETDIAILREQNTALIEELKEIEKAFKASEARLMKKLETSISNENLVNKLRQEKFKADQKYFSAMRSKDSLSNENKTLKVQQARTHELINQLKETEKNAKQKIVILEKNLENFKTINFEKTKEFDMMKNKSIEMMKSFENVKKKMEQLSNDKLSFEEQTLENDRIQKSLQKDLETYKVKCSSLEKTLQKYRKKNVGIGANGNGADSKEQDERIAGLMSIAKCSICSVRFKSTAIKTCGHVFCHECVTDRLNARLRKCPSCNNPFAKQDLLAVHL